MTDNRCADGKPAEPIGSARAALSRRSLLPVLAASGLAVTHLPARAKQAAANSESGTVWWSELRTRDPKATRAFYASVMGWTPKLVAQDDMARPPAAGEKAYTLFTVRGQEVAGAEEIGPDTQAGLRPGWFTYVQVDDVDEAARKAAQNGGKLVQEPFDIAGVGRFAEIEDPEGNRVGIVTPRA